MASRVAPAGLRRLQLSLPLITRFGVVRERIFISILALFTAAVVFEPRVRAGGFNADDWAMYAAVKFPHAKGFHTAASALENSAGSRVGHMLYWLFSFSLFGSHTRLYTGMTTLLAVILAISVYLLLRELAFSPIQASGVMILTVLAPSVSAIRFWFTPGGIQISLALFFIGLTIAIKAFGAQGDRRLKLQIISWFLYLGSAVYAETALPLIGICVLVYITKAPLVAALRRWGADLSIVVVGYLATLSFVNSRPGFSKLPSSMWGEHAHLIADQTLTIFTTTLAPIVGSRSLVLIGLAIIVTGSFTLWKQGRISTQSRRGFERWGVTFGISVAALVAGYAVFVPAMLYYEPLGPGLATHINAVTAAPLAAGIFSVLMLTRILLVELFAKYRARVALIITALIVGWYGAIVIDAGSDVRHDAHIWAFASERDYHLLHVLAQDLPRPVAGATIYTFGEAGTVAPGLPIFFTSWELNNAVKIAYGRADLSAYPIVTNGIQPNCMAEGILASVEATQVNSPSAYKQSYFVDVSNGRHILINNIRTCKMALRTFPSGPYVSTTLTWEQ